MTVGGGVWEVVGVVGVEGTEGRSRSLAEDEGGGGGELRLSVFGPNHLLSGTSPSTCDVTSCPGSDR